MEFNFTHVDDAFDTLSENTTITEALTNHWEASEGQAWSAKQVADFLQRTFAVELEFSSTAFICTHAFFNQQMMFDVVGYTNQENYNNAKGEPLFIGDPAPFLGPLLADDDFWHQATAKFAVLKLRSNDGE
ncbi:MAG: hypothetical protein VYD08_04655, partial [Pseudomonadota bacterium]|nr:hypothetical protein [Pseudomonadota bacterium]